MDLSVSDPPSYDALLGTITVFAGVPEEELKIIATKCRWTRYADKQTIWKQGEANRGMNFVISGGVQASYLSQAGKVVFMREIGPGGAFGEAGEFDGKRTRATWVAQGQTLVASFASGEFRKIAAHNPRIAVAVMNSFAVRIRSLIDRVVELGSLGVDNRIHSELLRLGRENPSGRNKARISPPPTHAKLAFHVNCAREAVTRELNRLKKQGVIRTERSALTIEDLARLEMMVESATGAAESE